MHSFNNLPSTDGPKIEASFNDQRPRIKVHSTEGIICEIGTITPLQTEREAGYSQALADF